MLRLVLITALLGALSHEVAPAQDATPTATAPSGSAPAAAPGGAAGPSPTAQGRPGSGPDGRGGSAPAPGGAKPPGSEESTAGAKPGEKPDGKQEEPTVIRRGDLKQTQGNPTELTEAVLGEDGRVAFQFRNQGWPELIDWLAELVGQPLDWQELPGDRVNVTTPGRYTVLEVVDLLNRHLLGRGYTLLTLDGGMTVVKCATLNPAMVPRVAAEDLSSIPPHSFVRASLDVGWLSAEKLAEELKPMLSENGKLTALSTTNRIEAIDAAITLRGIAELLAHEQDAYKRESLVPEFRLRHIPAEEAKRLLEEFLGISSKPEPVLTPQQMQQAQQMQQMRAQQGGAPTPPEPKKPEISVVANPRQNSILIQAPPDRTVIATEFLKRIDVPGNSLTSLADVQSRIQVFRLVSLDPEKLIEIAQEMNVLEPTTRIRVDAANRALIVSGSAADRFIIDQLISRLDGSGRRLEVLQLRRLEAVDVAESISFLMGKKEEKEENSRNRYPFYYGGAPEPEKKKEDEFRVAANTRFRQVLLWATEAEMAEVRNLLVKLGELPPPGGSDRMIRVIDADLSPETYRYLRGLEQQWKRVAPNPLLLPPAEIFDPPQPEPTVGDGDDGPAKPNSAPRSVVPVTNDISIGPAPSPRSHEPASARPRGHASEGASQLTAMQLPAAPADEGSSEALAAGEPAADRGDAEKREAEITSAEDFDRAFLSPPTQPRATGLGEPRQPAVSSAGGAPAAINVSIDAAGNLVLSSADTAALDQLESVMLQFAPPKRAYHVFTTRYASATWVRMNLEDYFKDEEDAKDNSNSFARWYFGFDDSSKKTSTPSGLGRPAKLRFIDDIDTGTIVVSNASAEQLRSIQELIRLWDVPEPVNKRKVRYTRLVSLKFGKAARIAETIKETYRDLLSSNDKAFQQAQQRPDGSGSGPQKNDTPRGRQQRGDTELVDAGGGQQGGGADFSFKGKLSLGIDELGNTLLVSAEGEPLLDLVCDMIAQLDKASLSSDGVQVINLSTIDPQALETALRTLRGGTQTGGVDKPRAANIGIQGASADGPDG